MATAAAAAAVVAMAGAVLLTLFALHDVNGVRLFIASLCDRSPLWHSTSNSIVSRNARFSSFSHSRVSENRR